jgi:hypothetical protein
MTKPIVTDVSNQHTRATLLGVVVDNQADEIHYLSAIGPKGSLQSIWASLASRSKGRVDVTSKYVYEEVDGRSRYRGAAFRNYWRIQGGRGMKAYWSSLPNTAWAHMVAVSGAVRNGEIIVITDPHGVYLWGDERKTRIAEAEEEFDRRFVAALNKFTDVPVLSEWGKPLRVAAMTTYPRWLKSLQAHGDALFAARLMPSTVHVLNALRAHLGVGEEVQP